MTGPQDGNQQRAAEVIRTLIPEGDPAALDAAVIRAALDAAEARGRAEVAAKFLGLAAELRDEALRSVGSSAGARACSYHDAATRLRALVEQAGDAR